MPLNPEQQKVLDDVVDGHNIFITGGAGVGKSFLVSHIVEETPFLAVTAMTGCEVFGKRKRVACGETPNLIADAPLC